MQVRFSTHSKRWSYAFWASTVANTIPPILGADLTTSSNDACEAHMKFDNTYKLLYSRIRNQNEGSVVISQIKPRVKKDIKNIFKIDLSFPISAWSRRT